MLKAISEKYNTPIFVDAALTYKGKRSLGTAYYDYTKGEIHISATTSQGSILYVAMHELTHKLRHEHFKDYNKFRDIVLENLKNNKDYQRDGKYAGDTLEARIQSVTETYKRNGALNTLGTTKEEIREGAIEEIVCDASAVMLTDATFVLDIVETDATLAERIYEFLKDFFAELQTQLQAFADSNNSPEFRALKEQADTVQEMVMVFNGAMEGDYGVPAKSASETKSIKHSKVDIGNGKQYVKADRTVITGDNPIKWAGQITNYINRMIRNGEDVIVYAADGDALTITRDTAGKAQFRNSVKLPNGHTRPMTDAEYAVKLRAEAHIDEIAEVSKRGNRDVPDKGGSHKFASDGFNYRTAYFLDEDGEYYRLTISVGKNGMINTIYNVGKIEKAELPRLFEAQRPERSSTSEQRISQSNIPVKSSIRDTGKKDAQDAAYLTAVENNDMETAQEMVGKAAKAAGYTYYRRTHRKGRAYNDVPWMMFADADEKIKGAYGDELYMARGDEATDVSELESEITQVIRDEFDTELSSEEIDPSDIVMSAGVWDNPDMVQTIYDKVLAPKDILAVKTQDGMLAFEQGSIVKSAAPVTYDDNGKVIPLSKRFDKGRADIRFAMQDVSDIIDTEDDAAKRQESIWEKVRARDLNSINSEIFEKVDDPEEYAIVTRRFREVYNADETPKHIYAYSGKYGNEYILSFGNDGHINITIGGDYNDRESYGKGRKAGRTAQRQKGRIRGRNTSSADRGTGVSNDRGADRYLGDEGDQVSRYGIRNSEGAGRGRPSEVHDHLKYALPDVTPVDVTTLKEQNAKLTEGLALAQQQIELTHGLKLDNKYIGKLAGRVLRSKGSSYDRAQLTSELSLLFDHIHNTGLRQNAPNENGAKLQQKQRRRLRFLVK